MELMVKICEYFIKAVKVITLIVAILLVVFVVYAFVIGPAISPAPPMPR